MLLTFQVTFDTKSHEQINVPEITEIHLPKCSEASFDLKIFFLFIPEFPH